MRKNDDIIAFDGPGAKTLPVSLMFFESLF